MFIQLLHASSINIGCGHYLRQNTQFYYNIVFCQNVAICHIVQFCDIIESCYKHSSSTYFGSLGTDLNSSFDADANHSS